MLIAISDFNIDPFEEEKRLKMKEHGLTKEPSNFKKISVTILGQPQVGKSALATRYCGTDFNSLYIPTLEEE